MHLEARKGRIPYFVFPFKIFKSPLTRFSRNAKSKRQKLSIELFGRQTFYSGLLMGIALVILTYLFLIYGFELLRNETFFSGDLLQPTGAEMFVYDLFFAATSIAAGFGICAWFWLH